MLQALLYDLVSTLVVLPAVTALILFLAGSLPAKRIWDVRMPVWRTGALAMPAVVIATSEVDRRDGYARPMTGAGQVRAIATISPSIHRAFGSHVGGDYLSMSQEVNVERSTMHGDLVCIGGPKTNEVTKEVLARIRPLLPAGTSLETVADVPGGRPTDRIIWQGSEHANGDAVVYGLIIRCRNPLGHRGGVLTILAGTGTYGTEAAAEALVTAREVRGPRIVLPRGKRRAYVALVRASCTNVGVGVDLGPAEVRSVQRMPWATVVT